MGRIAWMYSNLYLFFSLFVKKFVLFLWWPEPSIFANFLNFDDTNIFSAFVVRTVSKKIYQVNNLLIFIPFMVLDGYFHIQEAQILIVLHRLIIQCSINTLLDSFQEFFALCADCKAPLDFDSASMFEITVWFVAKWLNFSRSLLSFTQYKSFSMLESR